MTAVVEDQNDSVEEAMRLDALDVTSMTEQLTSTHAKKVNVEEEASDDDTAVSARGRCPPALRGAFVANDVNSCSMDSSAEACGNSDDAIYI